MKGPVVLEIDPQALGHGAPGGRQQAQRLGQPRQRREIERRRRKAEDEKAKVQNPAEKQKVDGQVSSRITELKKKHEQEKADLEKRQKAEEAKSKRVPVRRKTETDKKS